MSRILIIGCGQLGSRHLQAVACLSQVEEIEIVDPRPESLALGQERLAETADRNPNIGYRWLSSLDEARPGGDLCIVATQAEGRREIIEQAAERLGYTAFLIEKIVTQSASEYEKLMAFAADKALAVWVNCKTRAYPFHKLVKAKLDPSEPILFNVVGGNHGLACNGIHAADLFVYYDDCERIESAGLSIDATAHATKRGGDVFDLSGTLIGRTSKGSQMTISFAGNHMAPDQISIVAPRYRCIVAHMTNWAWESDEASQWQWRPAPFEGNLMVSNMTKAFAADILSTGDCELPTLAQSFPAHKYILEELLPYFSQFLGKELTRCPVT